MRIKALDVEHTAKVLGRFRFRTHHRTSMTGIRFRCFPAAVLLVSLWLTAVPHGLAARADHWIATWGTAQQLTVSNAQGGPGGRTDVPPPPSPGAVIPGATQSAPAQSTPSAAPAAQGGGAPPTARPAVGPPRAYLPATF